MKKIAAIVQSRMSSTRLPGKVMAKVVDKPLLSHVIRRAERSQILNDVIVATTNNLSDDVIASYCAENSISCFRGSEDDVLDRYYHVALAYKIDTIVRITGDCPLLDPNVVDHVIRFYCSGNYDFVTNTLPCTYPDGLDVSVFSFAVLKQTWHESRLQSEREHVVPYIRNHPEIFNIGNVSHTEDLSSFRWTVDEPQDLEFVRQVYGILGHDDFGMDDIVDLLQSKPELAQINQGIVRNEGYAKSLQNDRLIDR